MPDVFTAEEFRQRYCGEAPTLPEKANKFHAKRTEYRGRVYDSKFEAMYAARLDEKLSAGQLIWWIPQVQVQLGDMKTRVDFVVQDAERMVYGVECKGVELAAFRQVRKLWPKYGPFPLKVIKRDAETEVILGRG